MDGVSTKVEADIVVIGSGAAGLPAAITAAENGAKKVIALEKRKVVGGNSVLASMLFSCDDNMKDELFKKVLAWHRGEMIDPLVLRAYINKSNETVAWLKKQGVEFEGPPLKVKGGKGICTYSQVVVKLKQLCADKNINIIRNARCEKISLNDNGEVAGVVYSIGDQKNEIAAQAVIIATGGFTGNQTLLKKYFPFYNEKTYKGHMVKQDGDGIKLAQEAGAGLYDSACMVRESCQTFTKSKYHMTLMLSVRRPDIMIVNRKGERIIDESFGGNHPSIFSNILTNQPDQMAYALYDQAIVGNFRPPEMGHGGQSTTGTDVAALLKQLSKEGDNGVFVSNDPGEIATWIGADKNKLNESIERYNRFCAGGYDEDFIKDRRFLLPINKPPYYVIKFTVLMIDTIGPVKVNYKMEVIDKTMTPIPGLYAAGVVAGGWTSRDYCQDFMFGSGIGWSTNSGRIAGESAAGYLSRK